MTLMPSSSLILLFAASIFDSSSPGCPQQLFDQARGQVFLTWLLCWRRSFLSLLKMKIENARCSGVTAPCTSDFSMVQSMVFSSSTRTTSSVFDMIILERIVGDYRGFIHQIKSQILPQQEECSYDHENQECPPEPVSFFWLWGIFLLDICTSVIEHGIW